MRRLCISAALAFLTAIVSAAPPPAYRFKVETLAVGLDRPMEMEVAPDGRIFFNEIGGALKIYRPSAREVVTAANLSVFPDQENGFLGFALDPGFATNQWIYLIYSPREFSGQRVSRFVMRSDTLDMASEKSILEFGEQRRECCHHAGSLEFAPDGNLFISTGDNTHPGGDSDGYAPIDERPGREPFDAQKSSANTDDLRGKILRIRPMPDGTYSIPDGNLFPKDGTRGRPEIYVMGCRNPWRISVDSRTGILYWGDVGPDAGGENARGTRGFDELNQARRPGNFGWPYFVGNNFPYADYDFASKQVGALYDPQAPVNVSPNSTGSRTLPPAQPALVYWPYAESKEFPILGGGGRTACAGPVFHFKPEFRHTGGFPEYFDKWLLFYDWQRPFMKWARLDDDSNLLGLENFTEAVALANEDKAKAARAAGAFVIQRPVDSQFGSDGCLYLLDYGATWGANKDSQLVKISYQWGNLAPSAKIAADVSSGREPLTVSLSSAGSGDFDGDALSFQWSLHPDGKVFSTNASAQLTVSTPGNYVVDLRVSDGKGGSASAQTALTVGNTPPQVRLIEPQDGDFFIPGEPVSYKVFVRDAEDGNSDDLEEIFEGKVFVSVQWGRGGGQNNAVEPGLALMKQSDCFNCHAISEKVVGPPFLEVAKRYAGQAGAFEEAVQRVIKGSSGVWGEAPMLPHESFHSDQVRMMVRWVFDLKSDSLNESVLRGLRGSIQPPQNGKISAAEVEARYVDDGRAPAGPLGGKAVAKLRSPRLQAEEASEIHGARVLGSFVGSIDHGHYARFDAVNLSKAGSVTFRVASAGQGGTLELRSGSPEGATLASVEVSPTGGWEKWVEIKAALPAGLGRANVFTVFKNPGKGGLMNLDWMEFKP